MRIAICDDSVKDQEHFIKALHGWDPTMRPECFLDGDLASCGGAGGSSGIL